MRPLICLALALILTISPILAAPSQVVAQAQESGEVASLEELGISISLDPPQASAAALLELPTIYALPGSIAYWFKSVWEEVRFMFANTPEKRAQLLLEFSQKRLAEGYQAIQSGKNQAAIDAFTEYQADQDDLASYIDVLLNEEVDVEPYLKKIQEQLSLQKTLQEFAEMKVLDTEAKNRISSLLYLQPSQTIALERQLQRYVLGVKTRKKVK